MNHVNATSQEYDNYLEGMEKETTPLEFTSMSELIRQDEERNLFVKELCERIKKQNSK